MHIKIGYLAKKTGLTVRTLHHYDHIGLLSPSHRSENGFRWYSRDDVIRLQRIQALKQFGCSLEEIRDFLSTPQASLPDVIDRQIALLTHRIEEAQGLRDRLLRLNEQIQRGISTNLPDWLAILEVMSIYSKRFSKKEIEILQKNKLADNLDQKWRQLITEVQNLMDRNVPVTDVRARDCGKRWKELLTKTTGNNPILATKLKSLHSEEPKVQMLTGITLSMGAYMKQVNEGCVLQNKTDSDMSKTASICPPKPTAYRVAQLRAAHQLLDQPLIFDDAFAQKILGGPLPNDLFQFNDPIMKALRTSVVLRSRFAEDEWQKSYTAGIRQYVILGAGLDTSAFRFGHLNGVKIYEVDLPDTQKWKRRCLQSAGMLPPPSLCFVPMDFETTSLGQCLDEAGFNADSPACFSWLGVTMYLEKPSIFDTLHFVSSCARKSIVIFDYCVDKEHLSARELKGFEIIAKRVSDQGEPWKSSFDPGLLQEKLRTFGFTKVEDFGPKILNERYLANRRDGMRKSGTTRIMRAEI